MHPNSSHTPESVPLSPETGAETGPASPRSGGAGHGRGPRLEYRTHLDNPLNNQGKFTAKLYDFGDGLQELSCSFVAASRPGVRGQGKAQEENRTRSRSRAVSQVRRRCMAMKADRLLTLTYRENVTDKARAKSDLHRFIRATRDMLGHYVVVMERQKRGAWHFHLAISGYRSVNELRTAWREVVGQGNIDITKPRSHMNRRSDGAWKVQRLASYLAKYITKDTFQRSINENTYSTSQGIPINCTVKQFTGDGIAHAIDWFTQETTGPAQLWYSDEYLCIWASTWSNEHERRKPRH